MLILLIRSDPILDFIFHQIDIEQSAAEYVVIKF